MSIIDVQNAKQIRDPMQVLITMEAPDESTTLSFSGYSSAKVADGVLNHQDWPMRKIADLQGDGYVLDGTVALYDPTITASQSNGKLGVRGNVGEPVSVTVTGSATIDGLTVFASGAESVTYNGTTSAMTSGQAIIPVGASSITLTFNPSSQTERVLVTYIMAGTALRITNESIIRCVVSLRSDLSIIDPTLPESELNVEVYNDADISEQVANLPEDTPITYQAGYEGDMSPLRKFYVSGQVTWADNVLSIHAVDAVHFLDKELPGPFGNIYSHRPWGIMYYCLVIACGIELVHLDRRNTESLGDGRVIFDRGPVRDIIRDVMHWMKKPAARTREVKPVYVDAGRPSLYIRSRQAAFSIHEEDCGDTARSVERNIARVVCNVQKVEFLEDKEVGTFDWYKGTGAFLSLSDYVLSFTPSFVNNAFPQGAWGSGGAYGVLPSTRNGGESARSALRYVDPNSGLSYTAGWFLFDSDSRQGAFEDFNSSAEILTQVIPWSIYYNWLGTGITTQNGFWNEWISRGNIRSGLEKMEGVLWGSLLKKEDRTIEVEVGNSGATVTVAPSNIAGQITLEGDGLLEQNTFPTGAVKENFSRSPVTGSFTWKGDPRMQPRDVVTFHRLDGTDEVITLENITLTHEGGGTVAEVTYRKGIV